MNKVPAFIKLLVSSDDVDSAEYQAAVRQLEQQPHLAPLLEQLAVGDSNWWNEAQNVLAESGLPSEDELSQGQMVTIEIESTLGEDSPPEFERVSLDFLDPPSHPELLGRLDRYEVERVLGVGGMGIVLRAFDTDLHRVVAIKVLAAHLAHNGSARRRFAREAQAAAAVVHPHVIPIFNVESDAKTPYIVMHYVAGDSLQRRVDMNGPLPVVDALRIAQQTAAGLSAAHRQGLVHRDVKPANILLEEQVDRVMLSDFGLARAVDDASLTRTGIVAGTPHYMSPEQAQGDSIDHRSDLFSLGSVIYFMLAGHPPFRASGAMAILHRICQQPHRPLVQVNRDVPIEVSELVDRLLTKKVSERPATTELVEAELGELLARLQTHGLSIQPHASSSEAVVHGETVVKSRVKSPATFAAITVMAVAVVIAWFNAPQIASWWNAPRLSGTTTSSAVDGTQQASATAQPATVNAAVNQSSLQSEIAEMLRDEQLLQDSMLTLQLEASLLQLQWASESTSLDTFDREVDQMQLEIQSLHLEEIK